MEKEQHREEESSASEGSDSSSDESASDASNTEEADEAGQTMGERSSSGPNVVDGRVSGSMFDSADECDALEEMDLLKDDIQRKQLTFGNTRYLLETDGLEEEDTKVSLTLQHSNAVDVPGAFNCDLNGHPIPMPSQDEFMTAAALQRAIKQRAVPTADAYGVDGPQNKTFEAYVLDDMQQRMTAFKVEAEEEDQVVHDSARQKRKTMLILVLVGMMVVAITGVAVGVVVAFRGGNEKASATPTSSPSSDQPSTAPTVNFDGCLHDDATLATHTFSTIRRALVSEVPSMRELIEAPGSIERMSLCWLAEFDVYVWEDDQQLSTRETIERFALALIYYHFVGIYADNISDEDLSKSNWLSAMPACEWDFIDCNEHLGVDALRLANLRLQRPIPTQLGLLTQLRILRLDSNQMTGSIPSNLMSMSQMQAINLRSNLLTGTLPLDLNNLRNLTYLDLSQNHLTGTLPNMDQLRDLTM